MSGSTDQRDRPKRRTFLKTVGAAGLTGLAGCTGGGDGGDGDGGNGDGGTVVQTTAGTGLDSVKAGLVTSLSGPFAVFGQSALAGAELAIEDLQDELGVSVEIATGDSELSPDTSLQRMQRLVSEDGIDFSMGSVSSAVTLKIGTWASNNGLVHSAHGFSDAITGGSCAEFMFRPSTSNSMLATSIGQKMADGADTWYLMYSDYTWGQTAQQAVTTILEDAGKEVVGRSAVPFPHDDYSPFVNEAKASDADGIGVLIAGLDMRKALSVIIDKGVHEDRQLAMHQNEDVVYWGLSKEIAGVLDMSGQMWGPAVPGGDDFKQRVADNYDTDPFVRHFLGYVSMDQMVRAAVRADSTDPAAMRDELEGHEVSSPAKAMKGGGEMYWRECDHQLIQPTYNVVARPVDEMEDEPYKNWFEVQKTFAGDDVARSCSETGCQL